MSELSLHLDAARNAIADCGVDKAEIDGIAGVGRYPTLVAQQLGLRPTYVDGTSVGGCSFLVHVRHATAAIAHGLASMVLITHGESGRSRVGVGGFGGPAGTLGRPVPDPVRRDRRADDVPDRRRPVHEGARPDARAARLGRRGPAAMGGDEPTGDDARADQHRRRAGLAARRLSHAPARVLPGDGRWWRTARHLGRTGARHGPRASARVRRGHGRGGRPRDDLADGRLHDVPGIPRVRSRRVRECRHRTGRRRSPHGVRRLRAPPDLRTRGPRLRAPR